MPSFAFAEEAEDSEDCGTVKPVMRHDTSRVSVASESQRCASKLADEVICFVRALLALSNSRAFRMLSQRLERSVLQGSVARTTFLGLLSKKCVALHASNSLLYTTIELLFTAPGGRRTGKPSCSQRCAVRTPFPRYPATAFQEVSTVDWSVGTLTNTPRELVRTMPEKVGTFFLLTLRNNCSTWDSKGIVLLAIDLLLAQGKVYTNPAWRTVGYLQNVKSFATPLTA